MVGRTKSKCLSGNFCLKALDESRHGLPSKCLSGTSFDFLVWKNESNQTHVSGRTLSIRCRPWRQCGKVGIPLALTDVRFLCEEFYRLYTALALSEDQ